MQPETFSMPYLTMDDFLPEADAEALRVAVDRHFSNPGAHQPQTHQIWNYWHVAGSYTYLRTDPAKLIGMDMIAAFVDRLRGWARERLGMTEVSWPWLSLYVDGCVQGLHNDSLNGRFGYVFSLTRSDRKTVGGETMLLHEGDLFRQNLAQSAAGSGLFDLIEPRFNRLLVFDDRVPHGVQRVDGPMDPLEGRIVLHGHLSDEGPIIQGELPKDAVVTPVAAAVKDALAETFAGKSPPLHGPLVMRFMVDPEGVASEVHVLVDRVARGDGGDVTGLAPNVAQRIAAQRFPIASVTTKATVPILFGKSIA